MKVLARCPLLGVALVVADAAVVEAAVPCHVRQCAVTAHVTSPAADHDCELTLVVVALGGARADQWPPMPDDAVGEAHEEDRIFGPLATHLFDVRHVIDADTKHFSGRVRDDGQEGHFLECMVRRLAFERPQAIQGSGQQYVTQGRQVVAEASPGIHDAPIRREPVARSPADFEAHYTHGNPRICR